MNKKGKEISQTVLSVIAIVVSVIAIVVSSFTSHKQYEFSERQDYYNKRYLTLGYSYEFVNGKSELLFVNEGKRTETVDDFPKLRITYTSGFPKERYFIILFNPEEGIYQATKLSTNDIPYEGDTAALEVEGDFEQWPILSVVGEDGKYVTYYYILTYGLDGSRHLDCVYYQISKKDKEGYDITPYFYSDVDIQLNTLEKPVIQNIIDGYNYILQKVDD